MWKYHTLKTTINALYGGIAIPMYVDEQVSHGGAKESNRSYIQLFTSHHVINPLLFYLEDSDKLYVLSGFNKNA